jgi:hypothetical protein
MRRGADLINCYMIRRCSSANRCAQIGCNRCARRYARRVARDFLCSATGPIYAITINAGIGDLNDFERWRVSLWNAVFYRRGVCRWWKDMHLRIWCSRDGLIRGIIALGPITECEFLTALGSRWPLALRQIRPEALYDELYGVVHPDVIMADDLSHARYQPRQMTVRPSRAHVAPISVADAMVCDPFDDPMPVLII